MAGSNICGTSKCSFLSGCSLLVNRHTGGYPVLGWGGVAYRDRVGREENRCSPALPGRAEAEGLATVTERGPG